MALVGQSLWPLDTAAAVGVRTDIPQEIECLALTIYFEARGETDLGQRAVAHVVMNRVANPLFPDSVCDVVQQGGKLEPACQFTWWCDELSDEPTNLRAWERSRALARRVYWDYSQDPTAGALWYHADYVTPYWRQDFLLGPKIGRHIFYWPVGRSAVTASSVEPQPNQRRQ